MRILMYGPTYETRNRCYTMDYEMALILDDYRKRGRKQFLDAFFEGLRTERIIELEGGEIMSDIYDQQFKRRIGLHLLNCDPISADIICCLRRYVEAEIRAR